MPDTADKKYILPSVSSYQGRYFYIALILVCTLIGIAAIGNQYVQRISNEQVARIQARSAAASAINQVHQSIRELDDWLRWQIIEPGKADTSNLESKFVQLEQQLQHFSSLSHTQLNPALAQTAAYLQQELTRLADSSMHFARVSADIQQRFPGTLIMQNDMFPHTEAIMTRLNGAIYELEQRQHQHSLATRQLLSSVYSLRHNWTSLLSEFRLLVADHFSVFSDRPQLSIATRETNIQQYKEQLDSDLHSLQQTPLSQNLFAQGDHIWSDLIRHLDGWYQHFNLLQESMAREDWRQDVHLYKDRIAPLINSARERLVMLEQDLDTQASLDIQALTEVARNLSRAITLFIALAILLTLLAYLYLHKKIILPLAETTDALKKEARGETQHILPTPHLKETRDLVDAFSEMRQQVWKRQQGLDHLAHHDPLTQLPNRVLLKDRLKHALKIAQRNNQLISLMFLDLNNFKQVNDSLGHMVGDKLLKAVAYRLKSAMRPSDTVARLSGDEFAILIENVNGKQEIVHHAEGVLEAFRRPIAIDDHELGISASIGIAIAPTDDTEPNHLIRDADTAMYEAKRKGTGAYCFFSAELTRRATKQLQLQSRLRQAIENEEFLFHYQPIVRSKDRLLHCVEALIRWQPNDDRLKMPDSFLSTLLEMKISRQMSPTFLEQMSYAQFIVKEQFGISLTISINMSVTALRNVATHDTILNNFRNSSLDTKRIIVEITEDTLVEDLDNATNLLLKLKKLGIRIAMDDFGTGQSSLNHLRSFPFDIIKIDREFIRDIMTDPQDASLIEVIIQMAHNFGMLVVAEGAETPQQYDFLVRAGCDYIQGFYISEPLPLDKLLEYLQTSVTSGEKS